MQTNPQTRPTLSLRQPSPPARPPQTAPAVLQPQALTSDSLFGDQREILIAHADQVYRMRKTRLGKLILIK